MIRPLLSVAYSANVGGTGTLIGTPPNLILMELLETRYPGGHPLTFGGWMLFSLPDVLINLALVWLILQLYFRTPSWRDLCRCKCSHHMAPFDTYFGEGLFKTICYTDRDTCL